MSDEYEYDSSLDDGGVAAPVAPAAAAAPGKKVIADGHVRTVDRRVMSFGAVALFVAAICYLFTIKQTRDSMTQMAVAAPAPPTPPGSQRFELPGASPSSLAASPAPVPTLRSNTPVPIVYAPPPFIGGGGVPEAQPRTPSPEEVFAEEERRRILEARRAATRVALESDSPSAQQPMADESAFAQGSQAASATMPVARSADSDIAPGPHQQFLARYGRVPGYLPVMSRYELTRGTIINARWLTTLDSTLPGGVLKAMVTQTVYDSRTHSVPVLVPGTILTGEGDAQTQAGEARYLCVFDRVELPAPDSRKFYLGPNNAAGEQGENGASVSTDTHAGREFGHAFLYSMLQAGVNAASRAATVVDVGGNISQGIPQNTRAMPTFHQYVGAPLTIIVAQDLPLDRFQEQL